MIKALSSGIPRGHLTCPPSGAPRLVTKQVLVEEGQAVGMWVAGKV